MNLLTRRISWTTWEFGLAKIGFILSGVIIGELWPAVFRQHVQRIAVLPATPAPPRAVGSVSLAPTR